MIYKNTISFIRKILPKILLFAVALLILYAWIGFVDTKTIIANFRELRPLPALGSAFFSLLVHFIYSFSLKLLIDPIKKVSVIKIFQIHLAGAFLNSIAGTGYMGLIVEIFLFYKILEISVPVSISAFGIMRLIDLGISFFPLIFIHFIDFKVHGIIKFGLFFAGVLFVFLVIFIFLLVKFEKRGIGILVKLLFLFPEKLRDKFLNFISSTLEAIRIAGKSKTNILFAILVLLSLPILNVIGFGFAFFSFPFEIKDITNNKGIFELILSIIIGNSILHLLFTLPIPLPGQVGTMEWYVRIVFVYGIGFPASIVDTMIILIHPLYFFTTIFAGGISIMALGIRISLLKKEILNFAQKQK